MIKNIKWLFLVSLTFVACNNSDDLVVDPNSSNGQPLTAGTADFSLLKKPCFKHSSKKEKVK